MPVLDLAVELGVESDSFYDLRHQHIWITAKGLHQENAPVDLITIQARLREHSLLEAIGGLLYLVDITSQATSIENLPYFAGIVAEKFLVRRAIRIMRDGIDLLMENSGSLLAPDALVHQVEANLAGLKGVTQGTPTMKTLVDSAIGLMEARFEGNGIGVRTGLAGIDKALGGGLRSGHVMVLAGRPSMGKTALAMSIAEFIAGENALNGKPEHVLVFSLEMSGGELTERLLASQARVNTRNPAGFTLIQQANLMNAAGSVAGYRMIIEEKLPLTIASIRATARRAAQKDQVSLIVIDYLQLIASEPGARETDRRVQVDGMSRGIKLLAKELKVPVILISQLNREFEKDKARRPRLSDLRESGSIEQDADEVMILYEKEDAKTTKEKEQELETGQSILLRVCKNRSGPSDCDIPLIFHKSYTRYEDPKL